MGGDRMTGHYGPKYFLSGPGATENTGRENDGPSNSRGMKLRDMKLQDINMQDLQMLDTKVDGMKQLLIRPILAQKLPGASSRRRNLV